MPRIETTNQPATIRDGAPNAPGHDAGRKGEPNAPGRSMGVGAPSAPPHKEGTLRRP